MKKSAINFIFALLIVLFATITHCNAARIKDIAKLNGVRSNQLIGYGLVTGLNGTGDDLKKSIFTLQNRECGGKKQDCISTGTSMSGLA